MLHRKSRHIFNCVPVLCTLPHKGEDTGAGLGLAENTFEIPNAVINAKVDRTCKSENKCANTKTKQEGCFQNICSWLQMASLVVSFPGIFNA